MKYHTTVSTVIITLLILSVFVFVSCFTYFQLNIDSPGFLIVSTIKEKLSSDRDFSLSFSSIDRILKNKITINDIKFTYKDIADVSIENLTVYNNPYHIIHNLLSKKGKFEVDVNNINVNLKLQKNESTSSLDIASLFSVVTDLESHDELFKQFLFYYFAYSLNVNNLNLTINDYKIDSIKANIQLGEKLKFKSLVTEVPSYKDKQFNVDHIAFKAGNDGKLYSFAISGDRLELINKDVNLSVDQIRSVLEFENFASLKLTALPIDLSVNAIKLKTKELNLEIGPLSLESNGDEANFAVSEVFTKIKYGSLNSSTIRGNIAVSPDLEVSGNININDFVDLNYQNSFFRLSGLDCDFSYLGSVSLTLRINKTFSSGLEGLTNNYLNGFMLSNFETAIQYNDKELYGFINSDATLKSDNKLINDLKLSLEADSYIPEGKIQDLNISLSNIKLAMLDYPINASYKQDSKGISVNASYKNDLKFKLENNNILTASLDLSGFKAYELKSIINTYFPALNMWIKEDTLLNGYLTFSSQEGKKGKIYSNIAFDNIHFNDTIFGIASGLSAELNDNEIQNIKLNITSELIRFAYLGSINLDTFLPEGDFSLKLTNTGKTLADVNISLGSNKQYDFYATILSRDQGFIEGSINWASEGLVQALGQIKSSASYYPFDLSLDLNSKKVDLISNQLLLTADYSDELSVVLSLDKFPLPVSDNSIKPITINGLADYYFSFRNQESILTLSDINIRDIRYIKSNPEITINGSFNNSVLNLDRISFKDDISELKGSLVYPIKERRLAFNISNNSESISSSYKVINDSLYTGIIIIDNLKLERFGLTQSLLNVSMIGKGESLNDFDFSGSLNINSNSNERTSFNLSSDILINDEKIELSDVNLLFGDLVMQSEKIGYDTTIGNFVGKFDIKYTQNNNDRPYLITSDLSLNVPIGKYDSLTNALLISFDKFQKEFSVNINIDKIDIDNFLTINSRELFINYNDTNGVSFDGNMINGNVNLNTFGTNLKIDLLPVAALNINGIMNPQNLDLNLNDIVFNIGSINFAFPFPIIWFSDKAFVGGDLKLFGPITDTHLYGNLYTKGFDMEVWWLQKSILRLSDIHFSMVDNYLSTARTPVLVIDKAGGPVKCVDVDLEAQLSTSNIVDFFGLNVWIEKGQDVFVRVPIESQNMQIDADVYGHFSYYTDLFKNYLGGEIIADSGVFSYGMDPLPVWWKPGMLVNNNFDITLGENMKFMLPLSSDPILVAYMKDKTHFTFTYDNALEEIGLNGSLDFRAGEIYYFEKNFYITEGSLSFNNESSRRLAPVIDLTARLRDFDASGNKVDIYLILKKSTLTDLNPYFESSPRKDLNEIMSILGDAILPANTYGELNLSSVASLLTSGMDVMSRMGLLNSTSSSADLISNIRNSLNLDMFSLRTNLIENLVLDTIFTSSGQTISPVARYLDNTSIYLGKYLNENFFLQGMVHLSAFKDGRDKNKSATFLADDLQLDIEISLEWSNPLGTITFFTRPTNLSLYNIFDSFGFSFSKRIMF